MKTVNIKLSSLDVMQYDPKSNVATLKVGFLVDNIARSIVSKTTLNDAGLVSNDILNAIKQQAKQGMQSGAGKVVSPEEIIDRYTLVVIDDEETTNEKLIGALGRLCSKCSLIRHTRVHNEYMKLYDDVKIFSMRF